MRAWHFLLLLVFLKCNAECSCGIDDSIKREYGTDILTAFTLQSEGVSHTAMFYFEQGAMKAIKAGEFPHKVDAIRNLFVWYRTYGYFLGLIKKDPKIFGQYIGNGRYSSLPRPRKVTLNYGTDPEHDAKARNFVLGVGEILSGLICFWVVPGAYKIPAGVYLVDKGFDRAWEAANDLWLQKDISLLELQKTGGMLKTASK